MKNSDGKVGVAARHKARNAASWGICFLGILFAGSSQADVVSFTTPGGATWTVPARVTSIHIVAKGGGGSPGAGGAGGHGGVVTVTLPVQAGQVLGMYVGGGGQTFGVGGVGGGSTNIDAGTAHQIIAGGGGGGGYGVRGGNGDGSPGQDDLYFPGGRGGAGGVGGAGGSSGTPAGVSGGSGGNGNGGPAWGSGGAGAWGQGSGGGVGAPAVWYGQGGGGGGFGGGGSAAYHTNGYGGGGGGGGSVGPAGAVISVAYNGGIPGNGVSSGGNGSIEITYFPNSAPAFASAGVGSLSVAQNATATDISGLLHVGDSDAGQTLTWTQSVAPSHGTLSLVGATASSGSGDITPGGTLTYTPTTGYSGSDTFTVQVSDGIASATRAIQVTVDPLVPSRNPFIPSGPAWLDMYGGKGPGVLSGMVSVLSNTLQTPIRPVGQTASGVLVLAGFQGNNLSVIPIAYQSNDARPNGLYPLDNGQYQVVANGTAVTVAPAIQNLAELVGLLPTDGQVRMDETGVLIAKIDGTTYVARPGIVVQLLANPTGKPSLTVGGDGYLRFVDSAGNSQTLYPAFADTVALRNAMLAQDGAATFSVQPDATVVTVFKGQRFTLVPDLALSGVPAERQGQSIWQEGPARYRVANNQPLGTTQSLTMKP